MEKFSSSNAPAQDPDEREQLNVYNINWCKKPIDLKRKAELNRDTDRSTIQVKIIWETWKIWTKSREFTVPVSIAIGATRVFLSLDQRSMVDDKRSLPHDLLSMIDAPPGGGVYLIYGHF